MKRILTILFIFSGLASYGQGYVNFAPSVNLNDTARTTINLLINSYVRFPKYATTDSNDVAGFDSKGNIVKRKKINLTATSSPTPNTVMLRTANANTQVNECENGIAVIATAAGTTTLTSASAPNEYFTGSTTQNIVLPNATTLHPGHWFWICNYSTGVVTVKDGSGTALFTLADSSTQYIALSDSSTTAGVWRKQLFSASSLTATYPAQITGTVISVDTGRAQAQLATGGSLNKKVDSIVTYVVATYVPTSRTINSKALSSNITLNLASSDYANQGTTETILKGNASGNPAWSSIDTGMFGGNWKTYVNFVATGSVTGTGTTNTITKWTSSTAIGNSGITDNGTTISTSELVTVTNTTASSSTTTGAQTVSGGIGIAKTATALGFATPVNTLTDGATITWDLSTGANKQVTIAGNRTLAFSNPQAGTVYILQVIQDGTGSRLMTWPGTVTWLNPLGSAPILTTTASGSNFVTFYYDGTTYWGSTNGGNYVAGTSVLNYKSISGNYSVTTSDYLLDCTATLTATLPTAVGITGQIFEVRNNCSSCTITTATTSSQTINGSSTQSQTSQYSVNTYMSDGSNWMLK